MHCWINYSLLLAGSLYASSSAAQNEPVYLKAGSASINQTTHVGQYRTDVALDQGNIHLRAFIAETKTNEKNQLIFAMAQGTKKKPAHVWSTAKQPAIHAYADKIMYYPTEHRVELIGHAKVIQGNNSFSAPKILYNTLTEHVITESNQQARTVIIYKPTKGMNEHFIR